MRRSLPLLALCLALVASSAAGAAHVPAKHPARVRPVSAVPYVAPWATDFTAYSTQIYKLPTFATNVLVITIPPGQWWRIIYINFALNTGAPVGNRQVQLSIAPAGSSQTYVQPAAAYQAASISTIYLFGPGQGTYTALSGAGLGVTSQPMPDLLWQGGSVIEVTNNGYQAGDVWASTPDAIAVEVYTEDYDNGVTTLVPTPLIP